MALLPCPFHVYFVCCFIANIPYSILFADIGATSHDLVDAMYSKGHHRVPAVEVTLLVFGVLFIVATVIVLHRYTSKYAKMYHNTALIAPLSSQGLEETPLQTPYITMSGSDVDTTSNSTSTGSPTTDYGSTSRTSSIESK